MPRRNRGPYLVWLAKRECYYIRWTERGRSRERSTGTADRERAEAALGQFIARRGDRGGPRDPGQFPILTALEDYGREHAPSCTAPERIGYALDVLAPFWQGRMVADITRETCKAYERARDRAPATVRRELSMLRAAIKHEVREGRLTRPVTVFMPPKPEGKDRWLTRSEVAALVRATRGERRTRLYLPLFILIGLYTGARKSAILTLRWNQVDLERTRIDFNPPGRKRTTKARPIIPIPRRLLWFLKQARKRGGELGYVINRDGRRILDVKVGFAGAAVRAGLCEPMLDKAGKPLLDKKKRPRRRATVSPHTLRHTAGTWMAQNGVDLWSVGGYLGHSHARTVELYAHHHPDFLKRAAAAFD